MPTQIFLLLLYSSYRNSKEVQSSILKWMVTTNFAQILVALSKCSRSMLGP